MADEIIAGEPARYPAPVGARLSEITNRVSWGAIWAGVMIALGIEMLMTLFGLFIGFGMYNYRAPNPFAGIPPWTTAWYLFTAAVSMFLGAWSAARLSGSAVRETGILHGMATWGLATLATVLILAVGTWSVLREGVNVLSAAAITTEAMAHAPQTPPPLANTAQQANRAVSEVEANPGPVAQNTANIVSSLSLRIWGGVLLGFITAIFGGWMGRAGTVLVRGEAIPGPTRLAA
ncbi:MAG TPA: hypothetical protein VKV17_08300 [Bryobacteraceae bacterium]|nr:hypothetical protein [Bryobacteraceae bacterium]